MHMLNLPKSSEPEPLLNSLSLGFIEGLYADYMADPSSVSADWRQYFQNMSNGSRSAPPPRSGPSFRPSSLFNPPSKPSANGLNGQHELGMALLQDRVDQLVRAYRVRGHMVADIDPLGMKRPPLPELDIEHYGFTPADLERRFSTDTIRGPDVLPLKRIIERLRNTYCRSIGVQYMHMDDLSVRQWLLDRMEGSENRVTLKRSEQLRILRRLTERRAVRRVHPKAIPGLQAVFAGRGRELDPAA